MKLLNNINTYIKLIIVNVIIFIVLFFILDFIAYFIVLNTQNKTLIQHKNYKLISSYLLKFQFKPTLSKLYISSKKFRPIENINSKKKPILIFGCSFAYGAGLKDNETFSYQLGKLTGRPIYNRAYTGWAPQHMLYQLQNDKFYSIVPKPEYIIYVFIPNHIMRMYFPYTLHMSNYKYTLLYKKGENDSLKIDYFNRLLNNSTIIYLLKRNLFEISHKKNIFTNKDLELLNLHFTESKKFANKHWGDDIKFIIIFYNPTTNKYNKLIMNLIKNLHKNNFITININRLTNKNFLSKEYQNGLRTKQYIFDKHPNARAWEEITPLIVKELNL